MCPCVLFDKLKNALGIRKSKNKNKTSTTSVSEASRSSGSARNDQLPSSTSPVESPAGESPHQPPQKAQKARERSEKKGRSRRSKRKEAEEPPSAPSEPSSVEMKVKRMEEVQMKVQLLGQIVEKKSNPANFVQQVLQTERPDLLPADGSNLKAEEMQALDDYLLRKGDMRGGIRITLGKVVKCNSSSRVGSGENVTIVMLYAHGRFGAVHLVHRETKNEEERKGIGNALAMKTSRRMYASARVEHEIATLLHLYTTPANQEAKGKPKNGVTKPTHITPIYFHGTAAGMPYLIMPWMDANLEKVRQEIGQFPWVDAFYIGQEALIGIRECHEHQIVHRDIKPTNLLLGMGDNSRAWWLCDFGDACRIGEKRALSPPDAHTLVYLSRDGHAAACGGDGQQLAEARVEMDIESWFYMLCDLFVPLPWKARLTEHEETLTAKRQFWASIDTFLGDDAPPQLVQLAKLVVDERRKDKKKLYSALTAVLRDGFTQYNKQPPWTPVWLNRGAAGGNGAGAGAGAATTTTKQQQEKTKACKTSKISRSQAEPSAPAQKSTAAAPEKEKEKEKEKRSKMSRSGDKSEEKKSRKAPSVAAPAPAPLSASTYDNITNSKEKIKETSKEKSKEKSKRKSKEKSKMEIGKVTFLE